MWQWWMIVEIGRKAEGVATLRSGDGRLEWGRLGSMRSGEGFKPVTESDRHAISYKHMAAVERGEWPLSCLVDQLELFA
jgi:hypothetical protein